MATFGSITFGEQLGSYELVNIPATKLPQDAASAMAAINSSILGATYVPIWFVGKQLVNGYNYLFLCREIRSTKDRTPSIVGVVVNVPPTVSAEKSYKIVEIIEEVVLQPEIQMAFDTATKFLTGVNYKPIIYIGKQLVHGTNYHIICQAKGIFPNSTPYPVVLTVNVNEQSTSVVAITPIPEYTECTMLGAPLGEWP